METTRATNGLEVAATVKPRGTILVLEDEESVNRGITFSLEKAGYTVCSCLTGKDAPKQAAQFKPELAICDINLPDGSGLDFIKWLRKAHRTYIICLTARDQELDQVLGYEAGADDYITKPFSLAVLLLKIEAFFKRQSNDRQQNDLVSGNLAINLQTMCLQTGGREVTLTRNEWKLLNFFLQHPRQILSKRQLLENMFDIDGDYVDENTLAVNIRRLREKIEEDAARPLYIKNIRGLGYIWNQDVN